jgi:hypothetical protein
MLGMIQASSAIVPACIGILFMMHLHRARRGERISVSVETDTFDSDGISQPKYQGQRGKRNDSLAELLAGHRISSHLLAELGHEQPATNRTESSQLEVFTQKSQLQPDLKSEELNQTTPGRERMQRVCSEFQKLSWAT